MALALALALLSGCSCGDPNTNSGDAGVDGAVDVSDAGDGGGDGGACAQLSGPGTPLITNLIGARRLAADGTYLYAAVTGAMSQTQGRVLRVPLAGGQMQEVATGLRAPDSMAAGNGALFVADYSGLWRIDTATLQKTQIDTTANNVTFGDTELVIDGDSVVFATGFRWLVRVKQDGSGSTYLHVGAPGTAVHGLAKVGSDVYFLVTGGTAPGLYRVPADGSAQSALVHDGPADGRTLVVDGNRLLWTEGDNGTGQVVACSFDGKTTEVIASGLNRPSRIVRVGNALYVKDLTTTASETFFVGVGPCGVRPVGPVGVGPGDLLERDGVLFFTSQDLTGQGYVSRVP